MIVVLPLLLMSFFSKAAPLNMKPGLWEVSMKLKQDGKEFDPLAEIKKQLDKMPEAQRRMILEQMKKTSSNATNGVSTVCYTQEMIDKPESLNSEDNEDCEYKITSQTPTKIISAFSCKDGNKGTATWEIVNSGKTKVHSTSTDKKGKKTEMKYEAKFLKSKC